MKMHRFFAALYGMDKERVGILHSRPSLHKDHPARLQRSPKPPVNLCTTLSFQETSFPRSMVGPPKVIPRLLPGAPH